MSTCIWGVSPVIMPRSAPSRPWERRGPDETRCSAAGSRRGAPREETHLKPRFSAGTSQRLEVVSVVRTGAWGARGHWRGLCRARGHCSPLWKAQDSPPHKELPGPKPQQSWAALCKGTSEPWGTGMTPAGAQMVLGAEEPGRHLSQGAWDSGSGGRSLLQQNKEQVTVVTEGEPRAGAPGAGLRGHRPRCGSPGSHGGRWGAAAQLARARCRQLRETQCGGT